MVYVSGYKQEAVSSHCCPKNKLLLIKSEVLSSSFDHITKEAVVFVSLHIRQLSVCYHITTALIWRDNS